MTKAYSYARWSSAQQGRGDSLRRQLKLSREYAAEHELDLDESFRDPGVSAYRGKNHTEGALANFIKQIETGKVEAGSYLLIESLDRLSREEVLVALELFLSIVRRGVKIVTLLDQEEYDVKQLNKNIGLLYRSIGVMERAHEESDTKGKRVADVNAEKRRRAQADKTPMTALCPAWLKLVGNGRGFENKRYEVIPERAEVVRRIYLEAIEGFGKRRIVKRLNRELLAGRGVRPFRGLWWSDSSVQKILSTEAVLGIFQPHRKVDGKRVPDGPPIPGYFPAIIDEATFWRAREAIKDREQGAAGRKGEANSNLFSGLGVCEVCSGKLRYIDKGPAPKGGQYLACADAQRAVCKSDARFPYKILERTMLTRLGSIDILAPEEPPKSDGAAISRVAELEASLARRKDAEARFIAQFRDRDDPLLVDEIRKLGDEIKQIGTELSEARKVSKMNEHADRRDFIERIVDARRQLAADSLDKREAARAKLAQEFRRRIDQMVLHPNRYLTVLTKPLAGRAEEFKISPEGSCDIRFIYPNGDSLRFDHSVWAAIAPPYADIRSQARSMFMSRSGFMTPLVGRPASPEGEPYEDKRPALTEEQAFGQALRVDDLIERLEVRQTGPKEYEVVLAETSPQ